MQDLTLMLNLPLATIAVLAAGYLGYRVSSVGIDQGHQAADVVFSSLVFAMVAKLVVGGLSPYCPAPVAVLGGLLAAVVVAGLWRKYGAKAWLKLLRYLGVSMSDRHQSALHTVIAREGHKPSQLTVRMKNGSSVMSERLDDFASAPFGPCLLGPDGSVALYVTDHCASSADEWTTIAQTDNGWGFALTIIPASEVAEIEVRYAT